MAWPGAAQMQTIKVL